MNNLFGNNLFGNNLNNNNSLFGNKVSIFGAVNSNDKKDIFSQPSNSLFEAKDNNPNSLFGNDNSNSFSQESNSLFGANYNDNKPQLFGKSLFEEKKQNYSNINTDNNENQIEKRSNKKQINNKLIKCDHEDKYCAFYIEGEINLICYECIFKYNLDKEKCIPINNNFNSYVNIYQEYIDKIKKSINDKIINEINKLELNKNDNINSIFEKINLKFSLPIEVSFEERLIIGIKRKISNILSDIGLENIWFLNNYLNLYNTKLENLKTQLQYPYEKEVFTLRSEIPFNLKGIAIPKFNYLKDTINFSFKEKRDFGYNDLEIGIKFSIKDNEEEKDLIPIIFEKSVSIEKDKKYEMIISGIEGCNYINNEELYNSQSKISIESNNDNSVLASLIIE